MADFLQLSGRKFLLFGVANKKSVAYAVASMLRGEGAECVFVVRDETLLTRVKTLFSDAPVYCCDVENSEAITALAEKITADRLGPFDGLLHSIAFADYSDGVRPFHETRKEAFLQALDISCFSLVEIANTFKGLLTETASVVTVSISTTRMASENYGYMAPIKAALDSTLAFLTKSFSSFSEVRFNAVAPSLLKTSASAGIPGYMDSYLFAEQVIPRHRALSTDEAASAAVFLLSPRSSGITAQKVIVDAGMGINFFDAAIIKKVVE